MPHLIVIAGPTASGKTALALEIAQALNCEIISADSRQFYREMEIGTAKPSAEERAKVRHHFIDNLSIHDDYSAGQFEQEVLEWLESYFQQHDYVVMAGGSGMFIDAVCYGIDDIPKDLEIREELNQQLKEEGLAPLLKELEAVDPIHFEKVDQSNPQRIVRALEVYRSSGKAFSSFHRAQKADRPFNIHYFAIEIERDLLYERINKRCDEMMKMGWLKEAEALLPYKELNALNTVGYKDLFRYLEGELDLEECIEEIKKNTRRYAKRQHTWLRRNEGVKWVKADAKAVLQMIDRI